MTLVEYDGVGHCLYCNRLFRRGEKVVRVKHPISGETIAHESCAREKGITIITKAGG